MPPSSSSSSSSPLTPHLWTHRVLLMFATDAGTASFDKQADLLWRRAPAALGERDMVVYACRESSGGEVITPGSDRPAVALGAEACEGLRARVSGAGPWPAFEVVLVGKDGEVKARQREPMGLDFLTGLIDSMPMRQREMRTKEEGS